MPRTKERFDLNLCTVENLSGVDGLHQSVARRIVAYRNRYGDFNYMDDLLGVRGVGEHLLSMIGEKFYIVPRTRSSMSRGSSPRRLSSRQSSPSPNRQSTSNTPSRGAKSSLPNRRRSRSPLHRSKSPEWKANMRRPSTSRSSGRKDRLKSMVKAEAFRIDSAHNISVDLNKLAAEGCNLTLCGGGGESTSNSSRPLLTINVKELDFIHDSTANIVNKKLSSTPRSSSRLRGSNRSRSCSGSRSRSRSRSKSASPERTRDRGRIKTRKSSSPIRPCLRVSTSRSRSRSRSVTPDRARRRLYTHNSPVNGNDAKGKRSYTVVRDIEQTSESVVKRLTRSPSPVRFSNKIEHITNSSNWSNRLQLPSSSRGSSPRRRSPERKGRSPMKSGMSPAKRRRSPKSPPKGGRLYSGSEDIETWIEGTRRQLDQCADLEAASVDFPVASSTPARRDQGNAHLASSSRRTRRTDRDNSKIGPMREELVEQKRSRSNRARNHVDDELDGGQDERDNRRRSRENKSDAADLASPKKRHKSRERESPLRDDRVRGHRREESRNRDGGVPNNTREQPKEEEDRRRGRRRHHHRNGSPADRELKRRHKRKSSTSEPIVTASWCSIL